METSLYFCRKLQSKFKMTTIVKYNLTVQYSIPTHFSLLTCWLTFQIKAKNKNKKKQNT